MQGYVHSFESLAAVDGEGLRCAVFLSGCPLRCVYCHNPDTWSVETGTPTEAKELADKINRYKPYFSQKGGVTFSGGEPLCQAEFINETYACLKEMNISYAIDTSGCIELNSHVKTALSNAEFVILDLKFWDDESYTRYTKHSIQNTLNTLEYLESIGKRTWVRTVIVPGINNTKEHIDKYLAYIKGKNFIERYELLAFHTMGFFKYDNLGIENQLAKTEALSSEERIFWQNYVNDVLK